MISRINKAALVSYNTFTDEVYIECYNTAGDGGDGVFYWLTGIRPTENSGTIIYSSMNSAGWWQRSTDGEMATPEWFGAVGDGMADDTVPLQACIDWAAGFANDILNGDACKVNSEMAFGQIWQNVPRIFLSKQYAVCATIHLHVGNHLTFQGGTIIAAPHTDKPPLPYILATYYNQNFDSPINGFDNRDIIIDGNGFLDGNCVNIDDTNQTRACCGFWGNSLTNVNISGLTVINCRAIKWSALNFKTFVTPANSGQTVLTIDTNTTPIPENIAVNDIVRIFNSDVGLYGRSIYAVVAIDIVSNPNTITLDQIVVSDPMCVPITSNINSNNLTLQFIATGFSINGDISSVKNCRATNNTLGFAFGNSFYPAIRQILPNTSVFANDDNYHESLYAQNNDMGAAYLTCSSILNISSTFQHSSYENLIISRNAKNIQFKILYSEVCPQFSSLTFEKYPLNYICGTNISIDCQCPVDPSVHWYRAFQVDGAQIVMALRGGGSPSTPNNNNLTDISLVRFTTNVFSYASLKLTIGEYPNLGTQKTLYQSIVQISGSTYNDYLFPANCFVEATDVTTGNIITTGAINVAEKVIAISASTPTVNAQGADITEIRWTLGGNWTVPNPTIPSGDLLVDGKIIRFRLQQDATGNRVLTWGTSYYFSGAVPVLQTLPNAVDYIEFVYNDPSARWECKTQLFINKDVNITEGAYPIKQTDFNNSNELTVFADASGGDIIITLIPAANLAGYTVNIIKTDSTMYIVTVKGNGSELINASNTFVLSAQYDKATIKSNGTQNFIF